jgi:1,2-diacylglycerol 3-alpha-glucosyltransferase
MRLLVCAPEYYPNGSGIANVAYNVVKILQQKGVDCNVCSPNGPDIKRGSHYLIQKTGIIGLLWYWYQVSQYLKNNNYDVVWLHNPYFFLQPKTFSNGMVTIHTTYYGEWMGQVGGTYFLNIYKRLVASIERGCLLKMNTSVIFSGVGKQVCSELMKIGIDKDRIVCIPNGVNTTEFHPTENKKLLRKKFGIPQEDIVFLSVGRLTPQKQPSLIIEVFSVLEKKMNSITLCIAGKGELLESIQKLAKKLGIHKILFLNYVDNQDLPDLYACSDYFMLSSKYEGAPLTLMEAMASGLPGIVSDIPNLKMVQDADCGIVVHFSDVGKATDDILNYLKMGNNDHAKNARHYALENLDWNAITEQYYGEFLKIAKITSKNQTPP